MKKTIKNLEDFTKELKKIDKEIEKDMKKHLDKLILLHTELMCEQRNLKVLPSNSFMYETQISKINKITIKCKKLWFLILKLDPYNLKKWIVYLKKLKKHPKINYIQKESINQIRINLKNVLTPTYVFKNKKDFKKFQAIKKGQEKQYEER